MDDQGTTGRRNIAENFNHLSRVHQRYRQTTDRQTDGPSMTNSEHELEFTFAKNDEQIKSKNSHTVWEISPKPHCHNKGKWQLAMKHIVVCNSPHSYLVLGPLWSNEIHNNYVLIQLSVGERTGVKRDREATDARMVVGRRSTCHQRDIWWYERSCCREVRNRHRTRTSPLCCMCCCACQPSGSASQEPPRISPLTRQNHTYDKRSY